MAGNITNRTLENGTSSAYRIDQLNRQSAIQHNLVGGAKRFDYAFNSVSDITAVQRDSALGDGYTYDLTQQITGFQQNGTVNLAGGTVSAPATSNNMVFDGCGNRTSLNGVAQTFDNLNQLTPGAGISYNAKGDLTAWSGWACTYDAQNRLISASSASSTLAFYYDGKNRQIARSINGVNTFSVWDDWELVEEYGTGNVRTAAFVQGAHGPIKSLLTNVYFYQDSLGSTSHIAGSNGALLEYYKYNLNGTPTYWNASNVQITASAYNVRDLFTGERFVSEMGMYDLRNRYYSPELGRFLQPDPIGFKGDSSNLYRYCGNDWANETDPMGLQAGYQSSSHTFWFGIGSWETLRGLIGQLFNQPAGIALAQISAGPEGAKSNATSVKEKGFLDRLGVPDAIEKLNGAIPKYAAKSPQYPDPSAVVNALKRALKDHRIQEGNPKDFSSYHYKNKRSPMFTKNGIINIDPQAKASSHMPAYLAHEGQHLADPKFDSPLARERRAYDVQDGFERALGIPGIRTSTEDIRRIYGY